MENYYNVQESVGNSKIWNINVSLTLCIQTIASRTNNEMFNEHLKWMNNEMKKPFIILTKTDKITRHKFTKKYIKPAWGAILNTPEIHKNSHISLN